MLVDAVYQQEDYQFYCPVLAPGGLLFCLHYPLLLRVIRGRRNTRTTGMRSSPWMRRRCSFAIALSEGCSAMQNSWLWVGTSCTPVTSAMTACKSSLSSGSTTAALCITGEWRSPESLCFAKDRLYLVERDPEMEDREEYTKKMKTGNPRSLRSLCRDAEFSSCRATSCRSSRTQQSPRPSSNGSAASTTSCWRHTGTGRRKVPALAG